MSNTPNSCDVYTQKMGKYGPYLDIDESRVTVYENETAAGRCPCAPKDDELKEHNWQFEDGEEKHFNMICRCGAAMLAVIPEPNDNVQEGSGRKKARKSKKVRKSRKSRKSKKGTRKHRQNK